MLIPPHLQNEFEEDFEVCADCAHPFEVKTLDKQGLCVSCADLVQVEEDGSEEEGWKTFTGPDALKNALTAWCEANDFSLPAEL